MKKTCEECANCYNEYMLGGYPTPVCKTYDYLEETNNPHHDLDGEKCPDYTPTIILRGLRAKIKPIDDWEVPEELKEMISEVCLEHEALAPLKEQKHGHWIPIKTPTGVEYGGFEEYTAQEVVCSECGFTDDVSASIYTYCPNCGAKMDNEVKQDG